MLTLQDPIVFVAHSLGGIVVKDVRTRFASSTALLWSVVLTLSLGTPSI